MFVVEFTRESFEARVKREETCKKSMMKGDGNHFRPAYVKNVRCRHVKKKR